MRAMNTLLRVLRRAIREKKVTVAQLASQAGCSRQYVYNVLDGKSVPSLDIAERLAEAVGASLELHLKSEKASA